MGFKAFIIDDESKSRLTLKLLLSKYCPSIEVVREAASVQEGLSLLNDEQPDLLFLDVHLTDGTGFDILTSLKEINFKIVFTTAYDEYAIKAFKFSAIDYLLKPLDPDQLIELSVKLDKLNTAEDGKKQIQLLVDNKAELKKLALNTSQGISYISLEDIIRCEADSNYTQFYLRDQNKIVVSKSLKEYEEILVGLNFFRVHKSHLVNLAYVKKYDSKTCMLILQDGFEVEVARRRKDTLVEEMLKTNKQLS